MSAGGISSVLGRIAAIEAQFAPVDAPPPSSTAPPVTGFDPFGEVYQQAVEQHAGSPTAATATPISTTVPPSVRSAFPHPIHEHGHSTTGAISAQEAAAIAGYAGPPGVRPTGGYGAISIPPELSVYPNGKIPAEALSPVHQAGSRHRLHAPAAASWNNLIAEAAAAGFDLRITDSYRSYEEQVDLAERKGLYKDGGLAAVPGTSNHGWGLAVDADVRDYSLYEWLQVNAPRFGWVEAVPREPWHWEFRPNQV